MLVEVVAVLGVEVVVDSMISQKSPDVKGRQSQKCCVENCSLWHLPPFSQEFEQDGRSASMQASSGAMSPLGSRQIAQGHVARSWAWCKHKESGKTTYSFPSWHIKLRKGQAKSIHTRSSSLYPIRTHHVRATPTTREAIRLDHAESLALISIRALRKPTVCG